MICVPSPLSRFHDWMKSEGFHAYLVPSTDTYLSEYPSPSSRRLAWLTGFTGSWGIALITRPRSLLWTDGRYVSQAKQETDSSAFDIALWGQQDAFQAELCTPPFQGAVLGYHPWMFSQNLWTTLENNLTSKGWVLRPSETLTYDQLWEHRPSVSYGEIKPFPLSYSGVSSASKRQDIFRHISPDVQHVIMADSCSLAWLTNTRGSDLPYTPITCMYGILHRDGMLDLFLDGSQARLQHVQDIPHTRWHAISELTPSLHRLSDQETVIQYDENTGPIAITSILSHGRARWVSAPDPCLMLKACKNETERHGMRISHERDGVALCRLLCWLDQHMTQGKTITECDVVKQLECFRQENTHYQGPSFATIAGAGPHGAIIHYQPTEKTNRVLDLQDLFLLDSGGQYFEGTTDVTRTLAFHTPPLPICQHFTAVLKGHIALAQAIFPQGTRGGQLDVLARTPLWAMGWDYAHGTGHGVGSYLNVHEGPQNISTRTMGSTLEEGMVLSNEPGLYNEGHYGIRIENLMMVVPYLLHDTHHTQKTYFQFETLTLAPIDRKCIATDLLTSSEEAWVNAYHERVAAHIGTQLDSQEKAWLMEQTRPL